MTGGGTRTPFLSLDLRNADVGGDSGFDAALACLALTAAASELDGEKRKTIMTIHSTAPTRSVSGLVRLSDRTGPIAALC